MLASLQAKIAGVIGSVLAFVLLLFGVYRKGRKVEQVKTQAKVADVIIKTTKEVRNVEKSISDASVDERRKRLRKYARDPE